MFKRSPRRNTILAVLGILIIATSLAYVNNLAHKLEEEERQKVESWVEANKEVLNADEDENVNLATEIITGNKTIPIIQTNSRDSILSYNNLKAQDSSGKEDRYLKKKLELFKAQHAPIILRYNPKDSTVYDKVYYGRSFLLKQIRYFPFIQMGVILLFIVVTLLALSSANKSAQNRVWAGLAKETAHQLGTPLSSIEAWLELLKTNEENRPIVKELDRDLNRLKMISERFSKIGSKPELEECELISQVHNVVLYMKHRAPKDIRFNVKTHGEEEIPVMLSPLLFDWVLENLLKNALDAMRNTGDITIEIEDQPANIIIDVSDTGKGIPGRKWDRVFTPGFSTKKRGWGLGLSLSRRIIESYHQGRIYVYHSEVDKGTTFRILLRK